jgi:Ca-activated chloride channel homolog
MRTFGMGLALVLSGCSGALPHEPWHTADDTADPSRPPHTQAPAVVVIAGDPAPATWIGASPESEAILQTGGDTYVGVWIDVPANEPSRARAPLDLALVVDTSGSMKGNKIENARTAARALAASLPDGDVVSVSSFADSAKLVASPEALGPETRPRFLSLISELHANGSTNMAAGIALGHAQLARAPATHPVRRLVLISDGQANVGPSSPASLGAIAEQGLAFGAQVTSMGVGNDYDESTLNAIAVRTNGRLYHLPENQEMASVLKRELELLSSTLASDAVVVVAPAPGVQILSGDEANLSRRAPDGTLHLPIGTLFKGQKREAIVRVRVSPGASAAPRELVSVRLHYRAAENAGKVQEVVARAVTTPDPSVVRARANGRVHAIAAVYEANRLKIQAAQRLSRGDAQGAEVELGRAQEAIQRGLTTASDPATRRRLETESEQTRRQQTRTKAAASAPAAVQRSEALEMNAPAAAPAGR